MKFDYEENERLFNNYTIGCRKRILNTFFSNEELQRSNYIKSNLINKDLITTKTSISDAIKIHRNNLIDIKLNHTMRVVKDVCRISEKMNFNIDFEKLLKISALLHDVGRFEQAVSSNNYNDRECKLFNGSNHAEYGYKIMYINNNFSKFNIPENYKFAISQVIRYHQIPILTGNLALSFSNVDQLNVDKLTGNEELNDAEKIIVSALVQMVKDVDMLDIMYQHLTGEFPTVNESITVNVNNDSIEDISKKWGVSKTEILDYNGLIDTLDNIEKIRIPIKNMCSSKLIVPRDIQDRFFKNEYLDLQELKQREDWTFIVGMWWRLNHFLNNINFVSNLELVEENHLLESIYNTYPEYYKPLVEDAFMFAKEQLLDKKINNLKGKVYTK